MYLVVTLRSGFTRAMGTGTQLDPSSVFRRAEMETPTFSQNFGSDYFVSGTSRAVRCLDHGGHDKHRKPSRCADQACAVNSCGGCAATVGPFGASSSPRARVKIRARGEVVSEPFDTADYYVSTINMYRTIPCRARTLRLRAKTPPARTILRSKAPNRFYSCGKIAMTRAFNDLEGSTGRSRGSDFDLCTALPPEVDRGLFFYFA